MVKGFVGQMEDILINVLGDREPVEFTEDRGDVLPGLVWVRSWTEPFGAYGGSLS
jgi:hypothetical protein